MAHLTVWPIIITIKLGWDRPVPWPGTHLGRAGRDQPEDYLGSELGTGTVWDRAGPELGMGD